MDNQSQTSSEFWGFLSSSTTSFNVKACEDNPVKEQERNTVERSMQTTSCIKQCHGMTKQLGIEGTGHGLDQRKQAKSLRESVDAENGFGLC